MADRSAQAPRQAPWFTPEQLQALVNSKQIPPLVAQQQLSWQEAQKVGLQLRREQALREAAQTVASKQRAAKEEVDLYLARVPDLRNRDSATMKRVASAASEIAQELGAPITDPLVQRSALRQELGRLDTLDKPAAEPKPTLAQRPASAAEQELARLILEKGITRTHIEYWDRFKFSPERRLAEAKYYIPRAQRSARKATS